jgi:hypothetical protein
MGLLSEHYVDRSWRQIAALLAAVALLYVAGGIGMCYVAGFDAVRARLTGAHWWWFAPSLGGVLLAFAGYYFAYRGVKRAEDGPKLDRTTLLAVVTADFVGLLAHGGTALDELAMRAGGAGKREAKVRVGALGGFEYAVLAMIVCPASVAALLAGVGKPPVDFTWPWAVIPPPSFVVVIWLAERYRNRLRRHNGWRGALSAFFDTAHVVHAVLRSPRRHWGTVGGMALFWGAEMFSVWAATAAFGVQMNALAVIVAFGTGMILTRRNAPFAGAGLTIVALVPTLWYGAGVPFAAATLGVAAYGFVTLWIPLPACLMVLPRLRKLPRAARSAQTAPAQAGAAV